jgi:hypothetical protein
MYIFRYVCVRMMMLLNTQTICLNVGYILTNIRQGGVNQSLIVLPMHVSFLIYLMRYVIPWNLKSYFFDPHDHPWLKPFLLA